MSVAYAVIAIVLVVGWSQPEAVADRFEAGSDVSLSTRVHAWRDAMHIAKDFPLAGTGLNTFDTAMIFYQSQPGGFWNHAHNDYVQLVAEGGVLVAVPVALAIVLFAWIAAARLREDRANRQSLWLRIGAVTGLVAIALQSSLDFSLQLPGNAVMCATLVALALRAPEPAR